MPDLAFGTLLGFSALRPDLGTGHALVTSARVAFLILAQPVPLSSHRCGRLCFQFGNLPFDPHAIRTSVELCHVAVQFLEVLANLAALFFQPLAHGPDLLSVD